MIHYQRTETGQPSSHDEVVSMMSSGSQKSGGWGKKKRRRKLGDEQNTRGMEVVTEMMGQL